MKTIQINIKCSTDWENLEDGCTHLISEYDQTQIVHIVEFILLDVDPIHIHQNITNHNHRSLMIGPNLIQFLQQIIVQTFQNVLANLKAKYNGLFSSNEQLICKIIHVSFECKNNQFYIDFSPFSTDDF